MGGETERQVSGWTVDTLKEYVEALRRDDQQAVQAALLAAKEAVLKAENATEKRFESVNEFRKQLADQTNTFLARPEYNANHKALEDKVSGLTDRLNTSDGRGAGLNASWGYVAGAVGLAATIITIVLAFNN